MRYRLTAPCHFGLEKTLAFEVKRAGGTDTDVKNGRVDFYGDENVIAKANITCSVAERIGIVLASFRALTFDDIFENCKKIPIEGFAGRDGKLHVMSGHSLNSKLTSIPAVQRTIKKALVIRMQEKYGIRTLPESGAVYPIHFLIMKDEMTVTLDTSGEGLHKRGYRAMSNAAPIKETLAAGIADIARVRASDTVIDPFCGSGTILIEAAMKAAHIAPCLYRDFAAAKWDSIPKKVWDDAREAARADIIRDCGFTSFGYDIDPNAVSLTLQNAEKAGVDGFITVKQRDIKDFHYPAENVKIITNPPYGERLGELEEAKRLCRTMGQVLLPRGDNSIYVISSLEDLEELFGEKADKNRKLYNGMLMCRLYSYTS